MRAIHDLLQNLNDFRPFALTRFNDGEMNGIIKPPRTYTAARGDQPVHQELRNKLKEALIHEQDGYYKGIPCSQCFPDLHEKSLEIINPNYPFITKAVVQTNRNLQLVVSQLGRLLSGRRVIWAGGNDQDLRRLHYAGIKVYGRIELPTQDAWSEFDTLKDAKFKSNDVVLLSCGPLAEVLIYEWYRENPETTFIDIGSVFDPLTRNVWYRCHMGTLPPCKECN